MSSVDLSSEPSARYRRTYGSISSFISIENEFSTLRMFLLGTSLGNVHKRASIYFRRTMQTHSPVGICGLTHLNFFLGISECPVLIPNNLDFVYLCRKGRSHFFTTPCYCRTGFCPLWMDYFQGKAGHTPWPESAFTFFPTQKSILMTVSEAILVNKSIRNL